jgi:hypothetical protein
MYLIMRRQNFSLGLSRLGLASVHGDYLNIAKFRNREENRKNTGSRRKMPERKKKVGGS